MLDQLHELVRELIGEVHLLRIEARHSSEDGSSPKRPLTREEAAEYLGIHKDTLYRWAVEEGRIGYSRLGEGSRVPIRFLRKDLDDFLSRQRVPSVEDVTERAV